MYKIRKGNTIVDAVENLNYVRQNPRNKMIIASTPEFANGILSNDQTVIWHLDGLAPFIDGDFDTVVAVEISEEEYKTIREVLDGGQDVEETAEEIRKKLINLQERNKQLESKLSEYEQQLQSQNQEKSDIRTYRP